MSLVGSVTRGDEDEVTCSAHEWAQEASTVGLRRAQEARPELPGGQAGELTWDGATKVHSRNHTAAPGGALLGGKWQSDGSQKLIRPEMKLLHVDDSCGVTVGKANRLRGVYVLFAWSVFLPRGT